VTGDSAYPQGGSAPGHVHPQQMPSPSGYPSQQYSSSQPSHTSSRRSTVPTTHAYDHASFSPHPSAPPPSSGSTSYNPSFPIATVPARHSSTNPSGPPPPAESSISNRTVTMPMPVYSNTASSMPYDTRPQNTMPSSSQPGIRGGPQSSAQDYSYPDVHERHDDSSSFSNENLEHSREGTSHSGDYSRERAPPNPFAAGRQQGGHGGNTRQPRPPQPERFRCTICGRVSTRADAEYRRWYCTGGHQGQWQRV